MLVHHLADGIAQQYDELVKRFDLSLQLDAVDEKYGYRDPFLAQSI